MPVMCDDGSGWWQWPPCDGGGDVAAATLLRGGRQVAPCAMLRRGNDLVMIGIWACFLRCTGVYALRSYVYMYSNKGQHQLCGVCLRWVLLCSAAAHVFALVCLLKQCTVLKSQVLQVTIAWCGSSHHNTHHIYCGIGR